MFTYHDSKWRHRATRVWSAALLRFLYHTHYTPGRTSLNECSAQQTRKTNIRVPRGIWAPRFQHSSGRRPTLQTGRPLGICLVPKYTHQKRNLHRPFSFKWRSALQVCICSAPWRLPGWWTARWESPLVAAFGPKPDLFLAQSKRDLTQSFSRFSCGRRGKMDRNRWRIFSDTCSEIYSEGPFFKNYLQSLRHKKWILIILYTFFSDTFNSGRVSVTFNWF